MTSSPVVLTKRCQACLEEKLLEAFHVSRVNRLGRKTICKECISRRIASRDYADVPPPQTKRCGSCGELKSGQEFNRHRRQSDGLSSQCRSCQRAQHRKYYQRHKPEVLAKTDQWRESNPDKGYEYRNRHRARRAGVIGEFTAEEWRELKRRFKYRCVRCGAFEGSIWAPALSPDHVVPLSRGGANTIENIQPLCPPCNRWKRDKSIDFRNRRPYMEKVWMRPPNGKGDPREVEAKPEVIVPLLVQGWSQCEPPRLSREAIEEEVTPDVRSADAGNPDLLR